MQTHRDDDAFRALFGELEKKAERMVEAGESQITAGKPGEKPTTEYKRAGVLVRQMPDDEHGVLRISIGGHPDAPFDSSYVVFRGNRGAVQSLLRRALKALEYA